MAKSKPKSIFMVADGAGGMMQVTDRRFENSDWPISFEVPVEREQADRWTRYLRAECDRRGWAWSALGQLERAENSGTINIAAKGNPQLEIVWERKRGGSMKVKARTSSSSALSSSEAEQFCKEVNDACSVGITEPVYVRGTLQYDGLAWRGEAWLDDKTRLSPPSLQDEQAAHGPRIVHVDAILDCIGKADDIYVRQQMLVEVSSFLSVVTKTAFRLPDVNRVWVWTEDMKGCEVRHLGYLEPSNPLKMPDRNSVKPVPLYAPDKLPQDILEENEISLRADIADLWNMYRNLSADKRVQFLQAAAKWQEAMMHWQDRPSLSFTLMVIACEALKPSDADDRQNCYDIIKILLGTTVVDQIRQGPFPAQRVRSAHLHEGEFHGSELEIANFLPSYRDPSFRDAHRQMAGVAPAVIIEWLKRRGVLQMPTPRNRRTIRRWLRDNLLIVVGPSFALGLTAGWLLTHALTR
jgi:hypothetical protein